MDLERILDTGILKTSLLTSIVDSIKFTHYNYQFSLFKIHVYRIVQPLPLCSSIMFPPSSKFPTTSLQSILASCLALDSHNLLSISIHLSSGDIRVNRIRLCVVLFIWLPSLFIILLRFICVVAWSFLLMNSTSPPHKYATFHLFSS